ncbi:MAG: molybdopterin-synthase adenylyltransferase MoeB [Bacteroidota bacterium]
MQDDTLMDDMPVDGALAADEQAELSSTERQQYLRHLQLPLVGLEGQLKLKKARVLVVGVGGLGSPAALYLAAAGVGTLGLMDFDEVALSNLQRQILHDTTHVGRPKLASAQARLSALNPHIRLELHAEKLSAVNVRETIQGYDVVVDGTDNFESRYLLNDACVALGIPHVYGSVYRFEGQVSVFAAPGGPNVRDLYPQPPSNALTCDLGGVLGVLPGLVGTVQATEALKWILGIGEPLVGRLLLIDALTMCFRELRVQKQHDIAITANNATRPLPPSDPPTSMASVPEITVQDYQALRDSDAPPFLLDVRRPDEYEIAQLDGTLIPLDELPNRLDEIEAHRDDELIVVHCRSGARSARATALLHGHGFTNAVNLKGGILAWSDQIDSSVPKY